jgi:riboflavin transporter FmnP
MEPHNPVKDYSRQSPHEDIDREPDGVAHSVVGMTAGFSVMLALLVAAMFVSGGWTRWMGIALAFIAVPVLVSRVNRKSQRERAHQTHPSR